MEVLDELHVSHSSGSYAALNGAAAAPPGGDAEDRLELSGVDIVTPPKHASVAGAEARAAPLGPKAQGTPACEVLARGAPDQYR